MSIFEKQMPTLNLIFCYQEVFLWCLTFVELLCYRIIFLPDFINFVLINLIENKAEPEINNKESNFLA